MTATQDVLWRPLLVHQFVARAAQREPDACALIERHRRVSYGELDRDTDRVASLLIACGVTRGDRVLIALDNSIEFAAVYFGAMRAGAVAVPAPPGPRSDRLAHVVSDCTPRACVVDSATADAVDDDHPLSRVPARFVHSAAPAPQRRMPGGRWRDLAASLVDVPGLPPPVRVIDLDLAAIIYTSGSTGEPRGVMLTHRNIVSNTRSVVQYLALRASDRVMCVLPFWYSYGLSLLHTHAYVGGSVVIDNRFAYPDVVLKTMREHQVTGFAGVPATFALLLAKADLHVLDYPALRYITQAGAAMPMARIREWCQRGPAVPFYVMYGCTEASPRLTYLDPADLNRKPGSIGRPVPNVDVQVLREDGTRAEIGEIGELVARGSNISCGYWNRPDETCERFGPRGYRTGDLGYVDEEGYLFLEGRRQDMIKTGAHRVGPKEIEDVLQQHPAVSEAAVVGAPHHVLGEVPVAFVVLHEGAPDAPPESLKAFCAARLSAHKVPVTFVYKSELPRLSGRDKVDRRVLHDEASGAATGPANPRSEPMATSEDT